MSRRGDSKAVPGAVLRQAFVAAGTKAGLNLPEYLRANGLTFAQFLETETEATVVRRRGTDILVAESPADVPADALSAPPEPHAPRLIRQDFYTALTVFSSGVRYGYDPSSDRVVMLTDDASAANESDVLELPRPNVADEIALRREFARSRQSQELIELLHEEHGALKAFREAVGRLNLERDWHDFKFEGLQRRLIEWASRNHLEVKPGWFSAHETGETDSHLSQLLAGLARHMSATELSVTRVPLRAVQEYLKKRAR